MEARLDYTGSRLLDDEELAKKVRWLRVHGSYPKYYHHLIGTNSRLDALQAAIVLQKAPHLAEWAKARRANAGRYETLLADVEGKAADAYGVKTRKLGIQMARRQTFLIDPEGRIAKHYEKVDPATHSEEVLADIAELANNAEASAAT